MHLFFFSKNRFGIDGVANWSPVPNATPYALVENVTVVPPNGNYLKYVLSCL